MKEKALDYSAQSAQIRQAAVTDARHRAEIFAAAAGVSLGPVLSITESAGYSPQPQFARAALSSTPIEGGELSLTAAVTITWQILQPN